MANRWRIVVESLSASPSGDLRQINLEICGKSARQLASKSDFRFAGKSKSRFAGKPAQPTPPKVKSSAISIPWSRFRDWPDRICRQIENWICRQARREICRQARLEICWQARLGICRKSSSLASADLPANRSRRSDNDSWRSGNDRQRFLGIRQRFDNDSARAPTIPAIRQRSGNDASRSDNARQRLPALGQRFPMSANDSY